MRRLPLTLGLLAAWGATAQAAPKGFIVFSPTATQTYELGADKALHLVASGPAMDPADHIACAGRVFGAKPLLRRIYRLGPDLKEDRSVELGPDQDMPQLVAADDQRLFVFCSNTLTAYDAELAPAGRVTLDPGRSGEVVPVITVDDCQLFDGRACLLTRNVGDVFVVDLKAWTATRLPLARDGANGEIRAQWIDPEARTLNVLVTRSREEHTPELAAEEKRVIKAQVVLTFALGDLGRAPQEAVLYEEREIHKPYPAGFLEGVERNRAKGIIVDFPPPYHREGAPKGVYISKVSSTVPCYADVFVHDGPDAAGLGPSELVVLHSGGRTEKLERFRDEARDVLWFKHGGEIHLFDRGVREWRLRLQPAAYAKVLDLPGLKDAAALAY